MIQETASGVAAGTPEQRPQAALRPWEFLFLAALAAGMLAAFFIQNGKQFLGNDELVTALVVSNPSFSEMLNLIRHGGELNPPLFFITEWLIGRLFGPGEIPLRLVSTLGIIFAGWTLYFTARPFTGPRLAALAVALVLGLSRDVFYFLCDARYYGGLLFFVSLGIYQVVRLSHGRPLRTRDYWSVFLLHLVMVYWHLYGGLYSGLLFCALAIGEWLRGRIRWGLLGAIAAAWVAFGAWIPSVMQQLKSVSGGIYTPPDYLKIGTFFEEIGLQTPMALVAFLAFALAGLACLSRRPAAGTVEAQNCQSSTGWTMMALTAVAVMGVPWGTWAISHAMNPPPYMRRYIFPCIAAWIMIWALVLLALHRLPPVKSPFRAGLPPWFWTMGWVAILLFCVSFQPLRARKNPERAPAPFVDADFGRKDLPIVFENSWYFIQRAYYGQGRPYSLLIDQAAGEADPGWYTKGMYRFFQVWYPRYGRANIALVKDLPKTFLAVDDDLTKTFEYVFAQHPEMKTELLGTRLAASAEHGHERIYLVQNPAGK